MQRSSTNPGLLSPFHVAFPVHDLQLARAFYGGMPLRPRCRERAWLFLPRAKPRRDFVRV